jgi:hypothetical protein
MPYQSTNLRHNSGFMALRIIRVPWAEGEKCTVTAFEWGIPEISTLFHSVLGTPCFKGKPKNQF